MKIIKYITISIWCLALFSSCYDEKIPHADFNLHELSEVKTQTGDMQITVNWTPSETTTSYYISWIPDDTTLPSGEADVSAEVTEYIITQLQNDVKYTVSVQAVYNGKKARKVSSICTPLSTRLPVQNLTAAAGSERVKLMWEKPEADKLVGYEITYSPGGSTIKIDDPNILSYVVPDLTNDIEYTFSVISKYSYGDSNPATRIATPGEASPIIPNKTHIIKGSSVTLNYNEMFFMGDVSKVDWTLGDGSSSTDITPTHTYANGGKYNVTLKVTYADNSTETGSVDLVVIDYDMEFLLNLGTAATGQVKGASPVFSPDGKTVYISLSGSGTMGDLYAIDMGTNELKWIYPINGLSYGSGPAVADDGSIYVGSQQGQELHVVNPDGSMKWKYAASGTINTFPAIDSDGTSFLLSNDKVLTSIAKDGTANWTIDVDGTVAGVAVKDDIVYAGTSTKVYAINKADGSEKWVVNANMTEKSCFAFSNDGQVIYLPQKGRNGLLALSASSGTTVWQYTMTVSSDIYTPVVGVDDAVYFASKATKKFHAVTPNGLTKWEYETSRASNYCTPVIDKDGIIYFGSQTTNNISGIYALDTKDGSQKWMLERSDAGKIMGGASIGADQKLYIASIGSAAEIGRLMSIPIYSDLETGSWSVRGGNYLGNSRK